jgi:hypothetical protein
MKNNYFKFLLILSFSLLMKFASQAQIITNDFSPVVVIDAADDPYAFDFNGDGVIEFYFLVQDLSGDTTISGLPATYDGSGSLLGCDNGMPTGVTSTETSAFDVSLLNAGDELTVFQEYGSDTSYALGIDLTINTAIIGSLPYQYGAFLGAQGYLGAMFDIAGGLHLGWIEVSVLSDGSQITLHSYGYDTSPSGEALTVGNPNANTFEMSQDILEISYFQNILKVDLSAFDAHAKLNIVDPSGKNCAQFVLSNMHNEFDLSGFNPGLYIVSCLSRGTVITRKIIVP